ncbi:contact-dependent growth inhibition system immunity protein [Aeromonas jandaei]|uniref:contact-dependent growth inhibition system immunity protein n=1 Tax=Aeromonas jandaei TaxID=650 RepID=UPI003D1F869C
MTTFRKLIGNINVTKNPIQQSSLELWFERVIDIPFEELSVEDICRAIRQKLCIEQLISRVLEVLADDPLAGEYYDGELISALSTIKIEDVKKQRDSFIKIKEIINKIDVSDINDDLKKEMFIINNIVI